MLSASAQDPPKGLASTAGELDRERRIVLAHLSLLGDTDRRSQGGEAGRLWICSCAWLGEGIGVRGYWVLYRQRGAGARQDDIIAVGPAVKAAAT